MFSPRPSSSSSPVWIERFLLEREALRIELAEQIRNSMASIIGHAKSADLILIASDGRKFPAHLCILRQRAPSFYHRYVRETLEAVTPRAATRGHHNPPKLPEISIRDVDSAALDFFIRSIYTDEEVVTESSQMNGHLSDEDEEDDGRGEGEDDEDEGRGRGGREPERMIMREQASGRTRTRNGGERTGTTTSNSQMLKIRGEQLARMEDDDAVVAGPSNASGISVSRMMNASEMSASFPSPTEMNSQRPLVEIYSRRTTTPNSSSATSGSPACRQPQQQQSPMMTSFRELAIIGSGGRTSTVSPGMLSERSTVSPARMISGRSTVSSEMVSRRSAVSGNEEDHIVPVSGEQRHQDQWTPRLNPKFIPMRAGGDPIVPPNDLENAKKRSIGKGMEKKIFPIFIGMDGKIDEEAKRGQPPAPSTCPSIMARSLPSDRSESPTPSATSELMGSIRGRAIARRRQSSVSSLNSLCSLDMLTPTREENALREEQYEKAASKLAGDLLQIYDGDAEAGDKAHGGKMVLVETRDGDKLRAPLCTLWASSDFFRQQLSSQLCRSSSSSSSSASSSKVLFRLSLVRFSSPAVRFLLRFLHGGLTIVPPAIDGADLDLWELFELGAFIGDELFIRMLALNVRAMLFHFFHRPCASCVSAVFDALPKMELEVPALRQLFDDALQWQASHFARIWKGRSFLHLSEHWQRFCRDALLQSVDEESVVDVLLGCEKLQVTLPRLRVPAGGTVPRVLAMVADVEEYCLELLVGQFDSLIASNAFRSIFMPCLNMDLTSNLGKGLALNLALLEDILPPMVHNLSADTAIRSFIALKELLAQLDQPPPSAIDGVDPSSAIRTTISTDMSSCSNSPAKRPIQQPMFYGSNGSIASGLTRMMNADWNPRFKGLCHRLLDLVDRHMLHFANAILNSAEWTTLSEPEQARIREFGLFVEVRMPRAPPPRLSSLCRVHKRSSSVGIGGGSLQLGGYLSSERAGSLERKWSHGRQQTSRPSLSTQVEMEETTTKGPTEMNYQKKREDQSVQVWIKGPEMNQNKEGREVQAVHEGEEKNGRRTEETEEKQIMEEKRDQGKVPTRIPAKVMATKKEVDRRGGAKNQKAQIPKSPMKEPKSEMEKNAGEMGGEERIPDEPTTTTMTTCKGQQEVQAVQKKRRNLEPTVTTDKEDKSVSVSSKAKVQQQEQVQAVKNEISKGQQHQGKQKELDNWKQGNLEQRIIEKDNVVPAVPSCSSSHQQPQQQPQQQFDRQRTHTVMTVEQNVRAGIDAFLGRTMGKMGAGKPKSIVRPMPQQQQRHNNGELEQGQHRQEDVATEPRNSTRRISATTITTATGTRMPVATKKKTAQQKEARNRRAVGKEQQQNSK